MRNNRFKRVLIVGDTLRPWQKGDRTVSGAFRNIQWLHHLLKWILDELNVEVRVLDWSSQDDTIKYDFFDVAKYYDLNQCEINLENWIKLANQCVPCDKLWGMLQEYTNDALVVGYEMPPVFVETLTSNHIPFIDIALHPIRFMSDILHSIRTNDAIIHQHLIRCRFSTKQYWKSAALIKSKISRYPTTVNTPPGTTVIIGQVWTDRAISKNDGGFHRLENHLAELKEIVFNSGAVLYKPHPMEKISGQVSDICKIFKSIKMTDINYYHLVSQPTVNRVCGLNSSALYEAKYFGRSAKYLINPQYDLKDDEPAEKIQTGEFVTVGNVWTEDYFWNAIMKSEPLPNEDLGSYLKYNELRKSMNTDWGYDTINQLVMK